MKFNYRIIMFQIFIILISIIIARLISELVELKKEPITVLILDNRKDTIPDFINKSPKEGLKEALEYYDVKHPHIVHAQAILETGNFTSKLCKEDNNLFGLYNSKSKRYYKFNHWSESVVAYLAFVQYKYKDDIDYYKFLEKINYAEDPKYINKLKEIIKTNKLNQ